MNRISASLHRGLLIAAIVFPMALFSESCSAFQFSIKTRRNPPARQQFRQIQKAPRIATPSHWAYRQRPAQPPALGFGGTNRNLYATGYYGLPLYLGNRYSAPVHLPTPAPAATTTASYPSNITAYDAELRSSLKPATQAPAHTAPVPAATPATIKNQHFQTVPQQVTNSHVDLQQRLLQSRATPLIETAPAASNLQGHAEKAFHEGRYEDAAYYCDQAVVADPYNGLMHLFCSQCNFATGKYSVAIQMLEKATGLLPESQWGYIVKNYDTFYGQDDYVSHTRSLANYLRRRPDDNRARTLLGYHYGCLGYKTTASKLFHQSLQTYRNDELAQRLLPIFGEAEYTSPIEKHVQAPTPELLDEPATMPVGVDVGVGQVRGNRLIFLTPEQNVVATPIEELPTPETPEEAFFNQNADDHSVLLPPLDSPGR